MKEYLSDPLWPLWFMILPELVLESGLMKLRIVIWTLGLGFVGYALGGRGGPNPVHETVGAIVGAAIGCCVGWGLQRLLEMGRRR